MAAKKRGRPSKRRDEEEDGDTDVDFVDLDFSDSGLPDDLLGTFESDVVDDFPDEPPEGWPS